MTEAGWDALPLLAGYGLAIVAVSLIGGALPSWVRMTHTQTQTAMSLVAGLILGVALYHLLPHALARMPEPNAMEQTVWWAMLGIIATLLLLRLLQFHQHDFSGENAGPHAHPAPRSKGGSAAWAGIALGMGLHALTEGVALGAAVLSASLVSEAAGLAGFSAFAAIAAHKPLDALSITAVMRTAGVSDKWRNAVNLGFALICPVAALLTFYSLGALGGGHGELIGKALAFAAGAFLCISLSDLLPEAHFHQHDRARLALAFVVGVALAYGLHWAEPGTLHAGLPLARE